MVEPLRRFASIAAEQLTHTLERAKRVQGSALDLCVTLGVASAPLGLALAFLSLTPGLLLVSEPPLIRP
jgi:hypothetical protein